MSQTFPLRVWNACSEEIILRYWSAPSNGSLTTVSIAPGDLHMVSNAFPGMTVLAAKISNEHQPYASLRVDQPQADVHFGEQGAGQGKGQMAMVDQPRQRGMIFRAPQRPSQQQRQQQQQQQQQVDGQQQPSAATEDPDRGAPLGAQQQEDGQGGADDDATIEIPGFGLVKFSQLPPHVKRAVLAQRRGQPAGPVHMPMPFEQQQQRPTAPLPPFPDYDATGSQPSDKQTASSDGGEKCSKAPSLELGDWQQWGVPAALGLVILLMFWLTFRNRDKKD